MLQFQFHRKFFYLKKIKILILGNCVLQCQILSSNFKYVSARSKAFYACNALKMHRIYNVGLNFGLGGTNLKSNRKITYISTFYLNQQKALHFSGLTIALYGQIIPILWLHFSTLYGKKSTFLPYRLKVNLAHDFKSPFLYIEISILTNSTFPINRVKNTFLNSKLGRFIVIFVLLKVCLYLEKSSKHYFKNQFLEIENSYKLTYRMCLIASVYCSTVHLPGVWSQWTSRSKMLPFGTDL